MAPKRTLAALKTIELEASRGRDYHWGKRDCSSLIIEVCKQLEIPVPPYDEWHNLTESKASIKALKKYGSLGNAHQQFLILHSYARAVVTEALKNTESRKRKVRTEVKQESSVLEPCDVVSYEGEVYCSDGTIYNPKRKELNATGITGPECLVYMWTPRGLATVSIGKVSHITKLGSK